MKCNKCEALFTKKYKQCPSCNSSDIWDDTKPESQLVYIPTVEEDKDEQSPYVVFEELPIAHADED